MTDPFLPVKSADRTLEVLEALAAARRRRALTELAHELDIPKSSLHGIIRTMLARGWVEADATGTRFGLGIRALQVGAAYVDANEAVGLLGSLLDDLSAQFGETVHLGRLDGGQVVYLAKRESIHPLRLFSAIGRQLPAHATALGKALLAERADDEVDQLLAWPLARLTVRTLTEPAELHAALAGVRRHGYAVDREENSDGIICFAVSLPLASPAAEAISVSVPLSRVAPDTEDRIVAALRAVATRAAAARPLL